MKSSSAPSRVGKKRPRSEPSSLSNESDNLSLEKNEEINPLVQMKDQMRRPRPQKIIVLGAGVSGLACARELRQRGYEVLVVEARSRVGGRLKGEVLELGADYPSTLPVSPSKPQKGKKKKTKNENTVLGASSELDSTSGVPTTRQHPIDVGGALIHGIDKNPIHQITSQMGIPMHSVSSYCLLMDENGWPFDPKVDEKSNNFFNECLDVTFARAEKDRNSKESFGVLFERVCREKSGNMNNTSCCGTDTESSRGKNGGKVPKSNKDWETPLLKWHRANLELPTGASFYDLGHTWNEDEPYGFEGPHAAVESSWKLVMERLADGLEVLSNSPVTEIRVVLPNGTTPLEISESARKEETADQTNTSKGMDEKTVFSDHTTYEPQKNEHTKEKNLTKLETKTEVKEELNQIAEKSKSHISAPTISSTKKVSKRRQKSKKAFDVGVQAVERRRFSRRTRNLDIDVRRSSRSTKGVIERLELDRDWHDNKRRKGLKKANFKANEIARKTGKLEEKSRDPAKEGRKKRTKNNNDVEDIDYHPSSVVQVKLQDGSVLEADALVSTLPLGILKLPQKDPSHVRFVPSLNSSKKEAIEKLGCGLLNKCAISFPDAFWQDSDFLGQAQAQHSYLVLNAMKYTRKPILIFMYGGDFARDIEGWTDKEIVSDCLEVLKKICGLREIPAPIDYCITRWGKEEYSRMAFTYIPPGVDGAKALSAMSQPVHDPVLPEKPLIMFAGEHTTPYHPSTMHGAFLSGIREAYRFDLYMEPSLNNHMAFDENIHVYKHTFPTKRVYKRTRSKKKPSSLTRNPTQSEDGALVAESKSTTISSGKALTRGRGFGHMALRKRPAANVILNIDDDRGRAKNTTTNASSTKKNGDFHASTPKVSSRRSKRSVGSVFNSPTSNSKAKPSPSNSSHDERKFSKAIKTHEKTVADEQEVRALFRAVESYGPGSHSLVRSHILPVYGSTRRRTLKHIQDQWERLQNDNKDKDIIEKGLSSRAELVKSWEAKHVVSDNWDTHFARISVDAAKEASIAIEGHSNASRRSLRGSKIRRFFDS